MLRLAPPSDPTLRQIVGTHFEFYRIALDDADIIHSQLTRNICDDFVSVGKPYFKRCIGKGFDHFTFCFDNVVFRHISSRYNPLQGKYLYAVLADNQGVFVMRCALFIKRYRRPSVA